jgi:dinuclear metal center YbgI/SA1388 family protein
MERESLVRYLDSYLHIGEIDDYGPQGLQVESDNQAIERVALAVDTAPAIIEQAAAWQADMLLVHHGIFWGQVERIAGPFGERVRLLLRHGINLYAAHLALDAHPEVGNNAELARPLDVSVEAWWYEANRTPIGILGTPPPGTSLTDLVEQLETSLATKTVVLAHGPEQPAKIAVVSGAGAAGAAEAVPRAPTPDHRRNIPRPLLGGERLPDERHLCRTLRDRDRRRKGSGSPSGRSIRT